MIQQVSVEDISALTARKGSITVQIRLNNPPQLEEVDLKIAELVDSLSLLEENIDSLEQDYFQDIIEEGTVSQEADVDENWKALQSEYNEEILSRDQEYDELLKTLSIET